MNSKIQLDFQFSSAHFYVNKNWSTNQNKETFGKCYDTHGHGHDYQLSTVIKLKKNHNLTEARLAIENFLTQLDHHHINFSVKWFENKVPTTENITLYLIENLRNFPQFSLENIELKEDPYLGTRADLIF